MTAVIPPELQSLGVQHVPYTSNGEGHDIAIYQRH
jgi:hypothetical protein